mgnify:FL=1
MINPAKRDERFATSATVTTTIVVTKVLTIKYNMSEIIFPNHRQSY